MLSRKTKNDGADSYAKICSVLLPGLVSVSFRALSPREIIKACLEAQLRGIEWGGDVHVAPDDLKNARQIGQMTREAGLEVAAYGSYFRCDGADFEPILATALELGAPLIRVWAGKTDAREANQNDWARVTDELGRAVEMARAHNVEVATEFHGGTLTSSGQNARRLMDEVKTAKTLWQPLQRGADSEPRIAENLEDLRLVEPWLGNVHVYQWADDANGKTQKLSLENSAQWPRYVEELKRIGGARWLLLEFVPGDEPAILAREAAALRNWIGSE